MPSIDSLLTLVDRQGANELRLGADRDPQMFADGAPKRLTMPKTSMDTLRELLGELLQGERERVLVEQGQVQFIHEAPGAGNFRVTLVRRGSAGAPLEIDAVFLRARSKAVASPTPVRAPAAHPVPAPVTAVAPPAPAPSIAAAAPLPNANAEVAPALAALITRAAALHASDIHLMDGEAPVIRVDGRLGPLVGEGPIDLAALLGPSLGAAAAGRLAAGASADLGLGVAGVGRCRLNVFQTSRGQAAAIRLLRAAPPALAQLRLPVSLDDLVDLPHGLVIVCGPTGSGKSTTLAALAREALDRRSCVLLTLEDPIEYELAPGARGLVRQRQVGRDVKDFATGLRDGLREDPDILLIGEMRDPETVSLALTAAETGHLVLASLHSRSAASAVDRIIDTYPSDQKPQIRTQLADALRAVVSQRLIPRASGEGRAVALEVMRGSYAVASAIREAKTSNLQSAMQSGKKEGMISLERCLADLVQKRQVTLEAARAVANDPAALTSYLAG
ncbi:MAG: PilT/PilU family type 4a pilus ATPase [Byssovorax sp.]